MKKITKYLMAIAATALTATAVTAGVQAVERTAQLPEARKSVQSEKVERVAHEAITKTTAAKKSQRKAPGEPEIVAIQSPGDIAGEYVFQTQTYFNNPTIDGGSVSISAGKSETDVILSGFYEGADVLGSINADGMIEIPVQVVGQVSASSTSNPGADLSICPVNYDEEAKKFVIDSEGVVLIALYDDGTLEVQNDYCVTPLEASGWYALNPAGGLLYPANGTMTDYVLEETGTDATGQPVTEEVVDDVYNILITIDEENNKAIITNWGNYANDIVVNFDYNHKFTIAWDQVIYDGASPSYNLWGWDGQYVDNNDITGEGTDTSFSVQGWAAISNNNGALRGFTTYKSTIAINKDCELTFPYKELAVDHLEGSGTETDPFLITNVDEMVFFSMSVNSFGTNYKDQFVALGDDIDMDGVNFDPVGATANTAFAGTFDGQGHTISNLTITNAHNYSGLFGRTAKGITIKNVNLDEVAIIGYSEFGYVGGIAGLCQGTIDNCSVTTSRGIQGYAYVGGIAGRVSTITNCYSEVDHPDLSGVFAYQGSSGGIAGYVETEASMNINLGYIGSYGGGTTAGVGGIAGYAAARALVKNNINSGQVGAFAGSTTPPLGGIVGNAAAAAVIEGNINDGNVWGPMNSGGIVGISNASKINGNTNYGLITATSTAAGGVLGSSQGATELTDDINDGSVQVYYSSQKTLGPIAGGIIGRVLSGSPTLTNVMNRGGVYGTDKLGGIIGQGGGTIKGAVNYGSVLSIGAAEGEGNAVGGLIGLATVATTISDSYNTGELSTAEAAVANLVASINEGVNVTAEESYFASDFGAPADTSIGTALTMAELAALGSDSDAANLINAGLLAPSTEVFEFGDKYSLPLLQSMKEDELARVEAAAVIVEEGSYDDCTANLRISGMKDIEWSADKEFVEFAPKKNYAYITEPSTEAITITAKCGDAVKNWSIQLNVATGVIDVKDLGVKKIDNVTYYNVNGQESKKAFNGMNIVVTRYTDGTTSTVKVVK